MGERSTGMDAGAGQGAGCGMEDSAGGWLGGCLLGPQRAGPGLHVRASWHLWAATPWEGERLGWGTEACDPVTWSSGGQIVPCDTRRKKEATRCGPQPGFWV